MRKDFQTLEMHILLKTLLRHALIFRKQMRYNLKGFKLTEDYAGLPNVSALRAHSVEDSTSSSNCNIEGA